MGENQTLPYHNPLNWDEIQADVSRNGPNETTMINHIKTALIAEEVGNTVNSILSMDRFIDADVAKYPKIGDTLKEYFGKYPSAWYELKRKIHKYKTYQNGTWMIQKEDEEHILSVFLRLGRDIIPYHIETIWRDEILKNHMLIGNIANEPSLLDSSHGQLESLGIKSKRSQEEFIKKIMHISFVSNSDIEEVVEINSSILKIIPNLIQYLDDIFHIKLDIKKQDYSSVDKLSKWIAGNIWPNKGIRGKNAWLLVKSIRAWGGYQDIDDYHRLALNHIDQIPTLLGENGLNLIERGIRADTSYNDTVDIHYGNIEVNLENKKALLIPIEYRIKNIRSILLKLWESEDYNNFDALRDMIGLVIIFPQDVTSDEKIEIMKQLSGIMADKGYMAKNKQFFTGDDIKKYKNMLSGVSHKPLGSIVSSKKGKSSKHLTNASYSGFTQIDNNPVGIEIQFYNQDGYEYWKKDHYTFDPLKIISAWSRGSWFITPRQLLDVIRYNIPRNILEIKLKKFPHEIIKDYIREGAIIPYKSKNNTIYFVPKQYESFFTEKFPYTEVLDTKEDLLQSFISNISSPTSI